MGRTCLKVGPHLGTSREKTVKTSNFPRPLTRRCSILSVSNLRDGAGRSQEYPYPIYCFTPPA